MKDSLTSFHGADNSSLDDKPPFKYDFLVDDLGLLLAFFLLEWVNNNLLVLWVKTRVDLEGVIWVDYSPDCAAGIQAFRLGHLFILFNIFDDFVSENQNRVLFQGKRDYLTLELILWQSCHSSQLIERQLILWGIIESQ